MKETYINKSLKWAGCILASLALVLTIALASVVLPTVVTPPKGHADSTGSCDVDPSQCQKGQTVTLGDATFDILTNPSDAPQTWGGTTVPAHNVVAILSNYPDANKWALTYNSTTSDGTDAYKAARTSNSYQNSDIRLGLQAKYASLDTNFTKHVTPRKDFEIAFCGATACTSNENINVNGGNGDGLWLLSSDEANAMTATERLFDQSNSSDGWWLRSPGGDPGGAGVVYSHGSYIGSVNSYGLYIDHDNYFSGRPALFLNLNSYPPVPCQFDSNKLATDPTCTDSSNNCTLVKNSTYRCKWKLKALSNTKQATFTDVLTKNQYKLVKPRVQAIKFFSQYGISVCIDKKGKPTKKCNYNPTNTVNKGAMAEFIWKLWNKPDNTSKGYPISLKQYYLKDTNLNKLKKKDPSTIIRYNTIQYLASKNIFGTITTKYNPQLPVTRAIMAQWMYNLAGQPKYTPSQKDINLVKADYKKGTTASEQKAILWLAHNKITVPGNDHKYNPQNPVNRGSMAEFLQKLYTNILKL